MHKCRYKIEDVGITGEQEAKRLDRGEGMGVIFGAKWACRVVHASARLGKYTNLVMFGKERSTHRCTDSYCSASSTVIGSNAQLDSLTFMYIFISIF